MKRALITIAVLVGVSVALVSCGSSYSNPSSTSTQSGSGLKFRAFVSNPLRPASGATVPVLEVVDALQDNLSGFVVNMTGGGNQPGLMAVSPSKKFTIVFSALGNSVAVANNATETLVPAPTGASGAIVLPGFTESMVVGADNTTAFAAVRNAPVVGEPGVLGAVEVLNLSIAAITAAIPVRNVRYIVQSHNGNRILAFGDETCPDNTSSLTVISPSLIGTATDPRTVVCGFDHPVWGVFSDDDTTAYILNSGPERGGLAAGVTVLDMNTNAIGTTTPVAAATIGVLDGNNNLYVAGTPPGQACGSDTAAPTCGTLQVVDVNSMTASAPVLITDGIHNRMQISGNGQVFVGAIGCTNINVVAGEVRGCLSIFNSTDSSVVIPPDNGDVTGIEPISGRNVVYVVEDSELRIYDTTTDKLQSKQISITGQAIDVKVVDF